MSNWALAFGAINTHDISITNATVVLHATANSATLTTSISFQDSNETKLLDNSSHVDPEQLPDISLYSIFGSLKTTVTLSSILSAIASVVQVVAALIVMDSKNSVSFNYFQYSPAACNQMLTSKPYRVLGNSPRNLHLVQDELYSDHRHPDLHSDASPLPSRGQDRVQVWRRPGHRC